MGISKAVFVIVLVGDEPGDRGHDREGKTA